MINSINAYSTPQTGDAAAFKAASTAERTPNSSETKNATSSQTGSTQTISTLARQLSDSAARMDEQVRTLSRSELADKAKNMLSKLLGDSYQVDKKTHDSEAPNTDDPVLLARAKQATEFVNRSSNNGNEKNPFAGLSPEQLSSIIYDDSGTYTVNERRAAWMESYRQEEVWREKVCTQVIDEYNSTGKMTNFFKSVLDHYNGLPAIEQAQYPKDYASDLESKIKLDFNYRTHRAEGKGEDPMSLIEMLLDKNPKQITAAQPSPPVTAGKSTASQTAATPAQSTSVTLSGQALMLSRLFNTTDPNAAPPVLSGINGMDKNHIDMSPANFLTKGDRVLVSNMYGFAQQQGADLQYVDQIALTLGHYRQLNDGRMMSSFNSGNSFDLAGHQLTVNYNAKDTAIADNIQNGNAINSTQIDHGFLRYILDPGYGALGFSGDLEFLKQMVVKFSDEGTTNMSLGPKFSTYTPIPVNEKAVFTASKEILNPYPAATFVADYTSIDGVGHWRTPELEAAAKHGGTGKNSGIDLTQYLAALNKNILLDFTKSQFGLLDNSKKK